MTNHESEAKRLDELISSNAECHDPADRPFVETAEALKREASTGSPQLDANTAKRQRNHLMALADKTPSSKKPAPAPETAKRSWMMWYGGIAAAALAVLVAAIVVTMPGTSPRTPAGTRVAQIARISIPEAHAADAFAVVAEKSDRMGIEATTAFVVASAVPARADELARSTRIEPAIGDDGAPPVPVQIAVTSAGEGRFRIQPSGPLEPGKVYRISIATDVKKADGTVVARDFSWAMQTKQVFRVVSSVPAPDANGVPVNTGIEFDLSQSGWTDATSSIVTSPHIDGHVETHGRSLVFVPAKPLAYGTVYAVTLKKGLALAGSDLALPEDAVVRFETEAQPRTSVSIPHITVSGDLVETSPGKDTIVQAYWDDGAATSSVQATGYAISMPEAKELLEAYGTQPPFAVEMKKRGEIFAARAKTQAFQSDAVVEQRDYQTVLRLPGVAAGRYVVKVQPKGGDAAWFYLESTNVATYMLSDEKSSMIWAMNADTNRPLEGLSVAYDAVTARTGADGIVRFATPPAARATSTDAVVLTVGEGEMSSLILVRSQGNEFLPWFRYGAGRGSAVDRTVSFMYADRPLYHPTDKMQAFGMVQDRGSHAAPADVTLELTRSGIFDYLFPNKQKVYRRVTVAPDAQGFFRTSLDWDQLSPGYYQLSLKRGGDEVFSRSIEIRDFVKPVYTIEVSAPHAVLNGDVIEGDVRVAFFNGTPVAGMGLLLNSFGAADVSMELKTDADGHATFRVPARLSPCDLEAKETMCPSVETATIEVRPGAGEEAQILGSAWVNVWRSAISLDSSVKTDGASATVSFTARKVEVQRATAIDPQDVLGEPVRAAKITGKIVERTWVRVEIGQTYDPIEKKTIPQFRYEMNERDVAKVDLTTDAAGKATMPFAMSDNVSYRLIATMTDDQGRVSPTYQFFGKGWWNISAYDAQRGVSLEPTMPPQDSSNGYHVGDRVSLQMTDNGTRMETTDAPSYLFVETHLGIKAASASKAPTYEFPFTEDHVPNMTVRGVVFKDGDFVERQFFANLDTKDRDLKVTVTPDQSSYAPGAKPSVHVTVKDKDGNGVSGARVALGTVDEAVFAAARSDGQEYPLSFLYAWVSDGILVTKASHQEIAERLGGGGAEMGGGGGGDQVRRNFQDTASFDVVTTDRNGEATQTITLPDNLTGWRVTAVAMTSDRTAGTGRATLNVTKPVFVDVVAPSPVLATDTPVLKLRAFGAGLSGGEPVTFTVDAPSLGLTNATVTGTAGRASTISVPTLPVGAQKLTIRVASARGTDAIEKTVTVLASRLTADEQTQTDLAAGSTLPDPGSSREADIQFVPKTRAQYLWRLRGLSDPWSARLEAQAAARVAHGLLKDDLGVTDVPADASLAAYQKPTGGLAILPYASESPEVSAKLAALIPDAFDRTLLANYFWGLLAQKDASREMQAQALSGLAALGQPVLPELQGLAAQRDLSWRERLAVMRGLEAAGDREAARTLLDAFLANAEEHDGQMMVRISDEAGKRYQAEATAEVAAIAASFADPRAPKLDAWLDANWSDEAMTDADRAAYLVHAVPAARGTDVSLTYAVGGEEHTIKLADGQSQTETFTADEIKAFHVTRIDGPAVAIMVRRVARLPQQSPDLSIARSVARVGGGPADVLAEGDAVEVTMNVAWKANAPDGCYSVRDHLPAGLAALVNDYLDPFASAVVWYPVSVDGGEVSFVVCRPGPGQRTERIRYRARVIAPGAYTAEPAVMQSMDAPSVAAVTPIQRVTIK